MNAEVVILLQSIMLLSIVLMTIVYGSIAPWWTSTTGKAFFGFLGTLSIFITLVFIQHYVGNFPGQYWVWSIAMVLTTLSVVGLMTLIIIQSVRGYREYIRKNPDRARNRPKIFAKPKGK